MIAWQTYAIVEFAFTALAPQTRYGLSLADWYWKISLILLISYTVAGLILGAIAGMAVGALNCLPSSGQRRYQIAGAFTLALAFAANLATGNSRWPTLVAALLFAALLVSKLFSEVRSSRLWAMSNPWGCSLFLLSVGFLDNEAFVRRSAAFRFGLVIIFTAAFSVFSAIARRFRRRNPSPNLMRQAAFMVIAVVLVCGLGLWHDRGLPLPSGTGTFASVGSKPNVILVTLDTVRADHLSLYGYNRNTTPHLNELAASSAVFAHPAAASSGTLTSHSAILTGVYVSWNGARTNGGLQEPISKQFPMLAELLQAQGYVTGGYVANSAYLIPYFGFNRGFQAFESRNAVRVLSAEKSYCLRQGVRKALSHFVDTAEFDLRFLRANEINKLAYRFLEGVKPTSRPFFLFLNYMDAHGPYIPPAPYNTMFPGHEIASDVAADAEAVTAGHDLTRAREHMISQYDGGIAYIDSQIGELVSRLKSTGLYDNTLIVITADHGEGFGEHGYWGHGATVYETVVNVPLLIKFPGTDRSQVGKVVESAGHADILPTVLDVTGTPLPAIVQGRSLKPHAGDSSRILLSESFPSPPSAGNGRRDYTERAFYWGPLKFTATTQGARALYDLSSDPAESHDVCGELGSQCASMQQQLDAWINAIPARSTGKNKLDSRSVEHLKSLGYIGQ
jgi:arylsulfatase A-like enzyme